jgi:hypothetical protein
MRVRDPLLVEEEPVDPVGVAQHLHGPAANMRNDARGHVEVVADEVALRQSTVRKVDLVEVRELDFAATYPHGHEPSARDRLKSPFRGTAAP